MARQYPDDERPNAELETFAEEQEQASLWRIAFGPLIWSAHFLASYIASALVCAKLGGGETAITGLRLGIGGITIAAIVGIVWVGWLGWRQWDFLDDLDHVHDRPLEEDRHEFLGHASFLLAVISFVGVVYVAMPALFGGGCQ